MEPNFAEAERRIEEARRTGAEVLDLGDLVLSELPASLGNLPDLRALYLGLVKPTDEGEVWDFSRTPELTDLSPLRSLRDLRRLNLNGCSGVTDLPELAGLSGLQSLSLDSCKGVTDLSALWGLSGLQQLSFGNTGVTDLSALSGLPGLQQLSFDNTDLTDLSALSGLSGLQALSFGDTKVMDLSALSGLSGLQSLNFDSTGVTDLSALSGLSGLQSLSFVGTRVADLSALSGLSGLQSLSFGSTDVTDLSALSNLIHLRSVIFSHAKVVDISALSGLLSLQSLNFWRSAVTDLSPITALPKLHFIDCSRCPLVVSAEFLRLFADHPCLSTLILTADQAVGVPGEILSHTITENCLPRLRTYFKELDLGAEAENEVKVILLGNGRAGKTQLCRRFRGEEFDESIESTHGVQIWRQGLKMQVGGEEQAFQINWWDFGGQDIYHGTHALFLRSRAVFLILWTPALENCEEFNENGIPLRNKPLAYWLNYVRSLAGEGSPIIVVQSQCERFEDQRPGPVKPDGSGYFASCSYSAKNDLGRDTLEANLRDAIRYLLERNGALEIGRGRVKVRQQLYNWRAEDQEREPEERRHRTLSLEEFRTLCDEAGGIVSQAHALEYFHQTGVVFYAPRLFANLIVLDQDWALEAVYAVFNRERSAPLLRDLGRFTREHLALLVWQDHSVEEQTLFLGMMESCGVCFRCGKTGKGEDRYVAPDLLPEFETVAGRLYAWEEKGDTPTLRLEYLFFHPAIIRGLMSRVGGQAEEVAEYWKYGLWLKDGKRDAQILVQFEDTSTDQKPGAGALVLKAQGGDSLGLLREVRNMVMWQRIGEEPEELLTVEGTTVVRSSLQGAVEGRVLDMNEQPVSAAPFIAFFEGREHVPDEGRSAEESAKLDIAPRVLGPDEKPPEVFISYGWGDDTYEGRIRGEVVDALQKALVADGFILVRDRDEMRNGDSISAFIRRLTRADLVVALISDKYLRSSYCMFEIYKLWQKCQGDAAELSRRVVPIVLPEVKFGSLRDRVSYVRYWQEQDRELKEIFNDDGLRRGLSRESWEEARLVQEFADHVDDILVFLKDVLMPNKLEVQLEDGFQAVRDALRRRIAAGEKEP